MDKGVYIIKINTDNKIFATRLIK
ncbi:T9SS type A sorting domain-containing protein [Flavobacterium davisii]